MASPPRPRPPAAIPGFLSCNAWSIKAVLDSIRVKMFGLVRVSYGGFVGYRMAAIYPDAVETVALFCAGVCLEEKDLADGLFPVASIDEAAALLVPRCPD